jgi:hypothetical protein
MFAHVHQEAASGRYHRAVVEREWKRLTVLSRFSDRGCRLEWTRKTFRINGAIHPGLAFNAPSWVVEQVEPELRRRGAQRVRVAGADWLNLYAFSGPLDARLVNLLDNLATVMSIGRKPTALDHCFALDFYKRPVEELESIHWPNTEAGDLVQRSKYWTGHASHSAFKSLITRMSAFVQAHPLLAGASCVVSVPGRIGGQAGHGERLAKGVAAGSGKAFYPTRALYGQREAAKEGSPLRIDQVDVDSAVFFDDAVIVVDDVIRSGNSMNAVATSARTKGAVQVYGLAAAKTLRN